MIEKKLRDKIASLIADADHIESVQEDVDEKLWLAEVNAWATSVLNVIKLALPDFLHPYRTGIERAAAPYVPASERLLTVRSTLRTLLDDVKEGFVGDIADKIRAETFGDLLDQARRNLDLGFKDYAGVIAAVMFEDTTRKIYADNIDKVTRPDLEQVIIALEKNEIITSEQARQARVAQLVRNKALHADWNAFTKQGVEDTVRITKALIEAHLK